ncbi:MAG: GNAT family N-acetyltransferase [Acidimicrobiales bacterium]
MFWRRSTSEFACNRGAGNRSALEALIGRADPPGLLAYRDAHPIGWCALGPRETFSRLERSRMLIRVDARPVWSIPCFFVDRHHRRTGVAAELLRSAVAVARSRGVATLEAYPMGGSSRPSNSEAYTGVAEMFAREGFTPVAAAGRRIVMRLELAAQRQWDGCGYVASTRQGGVR